MVHLAIDKGINYFDTAYPYHGKDFSSGGGGEPFLARALKKADRENIYITTKLPSWMIETRKDMDRYLDEQLERLDTEYIDFYLLHAIKRSLWEKLVRLGILEFLDSAIKSGKIRHAGFSFHDDLSLFKEIVDAYDWSLCQIQYNYFDEDYQAGRAGLEYAAERDIAVKENLDLAENVSEARWTEKDEDAVRKAKGIINDLQRVNCTTCGYCMPCPEGVDIPFNLSLSNDHHIFNDQGAGFRYKLVLGEKERASNCIQCGECLDKCPQQIQIPEELEHVADLFE